MDAVLHRQERSGSSGVSDKLSATSVICLDTCIVLDILRDPCRDSVWVEEQRASLSLLGLAETGEYLEARIAEQVVREYSANVDTVHGETIKSIEKLQSNVLKIDQLMELYNIASRQTTDRWNEYAIKSRDAANRWIQIGQQIPSTPQIALRANQRALNSDRKPLAYKGIPNLKDCMVIESYLSYASEARSLSNKAKIVFVSSNTKDFADESGSEVSEKLHEEFDALDLKYAPNMRTARALLGLV